MVLEKLFQILRENGDEYLGFKHPGRTGANLESSAGYHTWFDIDTDIP